MYHLKERGQLEGLLPVLSISEYDSGQNMTEGHGIQKHPVRSEPWNNSPLVKNRTGWPGIESGTLTSRQ